MSLRINHNTRAANAHRNLQANDHQLSKSLERLSSGLRINQAGDGPSSLVISEQMRAQLAGLDQAIKNSELSISMVQTAEGALNEANQLLVGIRQLAIHAANEGANDEVMLLADQQEISNALISIDRIATTTQFGKRNLLDGSNGATGITTGQGLHFTKASNKTADSGDEEYEVVILTDASRANLKGTTALSEEVVQAGEIMTISENGKTATYTTTQTDTIKTAFQNLDAAVRRSGLDVTLEMTDGNQLSVRHNLYGKDHGFSVSSTTDGVLSPIGDSFEDIANGTDIVGTINGESTIGRGQTLVGRTGSATTEGIELRYTGEAGDEGEIPEEGVAVGTVKLSQNSLTFQVGANAGQTVGIALPNIEATKLGRGVQNSNDFISLADVDVRTSAGAQDTIKIVDESINQISAMRSDLGSFQKNTLESNLTNLRVANENMLAAESTIRDVDVAAEMANFTKESIKMQSSTAMLAQANQVPSKILHLLGQA